MEETICAADTLCIAPRDRYACCILLGDPGEGELKLKIWAQEHSRHKEMFLRFIINKKEIEKGA